MARGVVSLAMEGRERRVRVKDMLFAVEMMVGVVEGCGGAVSQVQ